MVIVCAIAYWIITLIPLPPPARQIVLVILGLIVLLIVLARALPLLGFHA